VEASRLYLLGFLLVLLGTGLLIAGNVGSQSTSFAGVVFIGPFPIVFGSGPGAETLIPIAVLIAAAMVLIFCLSILLSRRTWRGYERKSA